MAKSQKAAFKSSNNDYDGTIPKNRKVTELISPER
jgi:hypothetical protein